MTDFELELKMMEQDALLLETVERKARQRFIRTAEGARKYGAPIGTLITRDLIERAERRRAGGGGDKPRSARASRAADPVNAAQTAKRGETRAAKKAERDRRGGIDADRQIAERQELAKLNQRRKKQGKPPLLTLPAGKEPKADAPRLGKPKKAPAKRTPKDTETPPIGAGTSSRQGREAKGDGEKPMPAGKYSAGDPRNDPDYEAYTEQLDRRIEAAMAAGLDTETAHTVVVDPKSGARAYSAARTAEHLRILDQIMANAEGVPSDKKAIMMGGLPGAGKSTFLKNHGEKLGLEVDENGNPTNAIVINPDEMKALLLEGTDLDGNPLVPDIDGLQRGEMAALVHEESSHLANLLASRALAQGKNVVFDITLGDGQKARKKYLENDRGTGAKDLGYEVRAAFVDGDMATSLHRAGLRHKRPDKETGQRGYTGRYVKYGHIEAQAAPEGAKASDGSPAKSQNRLEYDALTGEGVFDQALRFDNVTGEFTEDKEYTAPTPSDGDEESVRLASQEAMLLEDDDDLGNPGADGTPTLSEFEVAGAGGGSSEYTATVDVDGTTHLVELSMDDPTDDGVTGYISLRGPVGNDSDEAMDELAFAQVTLTKEDLGLEPEDELDFDEAQDSFRAWAEGPGLVAMLEDYRATNNEETD